ncbi:MAG: signal peptide peptidase SppA, type [Bacteroidetes bacterium]|uniref:signal peptide peptidase SppA n=1 Tax=Chitinophaga sp. LS1 TaxID=3051176 RepID=UPI001D5325C6|nr:signal peptide peptidase SppA [Chitinophaga sp. LS1]MBP1652601.1 signal peptide peptidase SppA, type [Bacteroidota bacterium]WPV63834.1 signal peptide peptidase SppA [Chitinophaga sp. LS1]
MRSFFKIFFATLLALIVVGVLGIVILLGLIGSALSPDKVVISPNGVLVLETNQELSEQKVANPLSMLTKKGDGGTPGLFDVIRLVDNATGDDNIKGIYLKVEGNANGFATNQEFRNALERFKASGKWIYAYGENMSQQSYFVASVANKVYLHPKGGLDFNGFYSQVTFLKGLLEKLEIQPQIFYDGRFKSATEPLRETEMTPANRIQTNAYLGELYSNFLYNIGQSRKIDTATLHKYANDGAIQHAEDAARLKLVDGLRYDDQVMDEIKSRLSLSGTDKVNFVTLSNYENANEHRFRDNDAKIALIYAQGSIVGGDSEKETVISSDRYIKLIREARQDKDIKAIVFRVNSPGGSALASESIWRELTLAKKDKPVIVSMGDYAASGGYYISCMADSIFAEPNTLTGSIGVFAVIPNLGNFFKNKLGVTFDGVKTAQYADLGTASRAMTDDEKRFIQNGVDTTYMVFKTRVVNGRKLSGAVVDSIAQGRVWSGVQAKELGLVDRIGGIQDAIACAAKMVHAGSFNVKEYPEPQGGLEKVVRSLGGDMQSRMVKKELGENYNLYEQVKRIKEMSGQVQARIPFDIEIK